MRFTWMSLLSVDCVCTSFLHQFSNSYCWIQIREGQGVADSQLSTDGAKQKLVSFIVVSSDLWREESGGGLGTQLKCEHVVTVVCEWGLAVSSIAVFVSGVTISDQ